MARHKERDGPLERERGRGQIDRHTSSPGPTQSEPESIFSNSIRISGADETGSAGEVEFHAGWPVILRRRSSEAHRRRWELVVVGKADGGERARCLESLLRGDGLSDDEGVAGVREPRGVPLPDSSGAVALQSGGEGPTVSA